MSKEDKERNIFICTYEISCMLTFKPLEVLESLPFVFIVIIKKFHNFCIRYLVVMFIIY